MRIFSEPIGLFILRSSKIHCKIVSVTQVSLEVKSRNTSRSSIPVGVRFDDQVAVVGVSETLSSRTYREPVQHK